MAWKLECWEAIKLEKIDYPLPQSFPAFRPPGFPAYFDYIFKEAIYGITI
jgi:hypothetical protein